MARWLRKIEIGICLAIARLMILFLPFRILRKTLGPFGEHDAVVEVCNYSGEQERLVKSIGRNIKNIADRVPFKAVCLPQAMTGRWMLARRGIQSKVFIGVRKGKNEKPVDLHAWLMVGETCVTGDNERLEFQAFARKSAGANYSGSNRAG